MEVAGVAKQFDELMPLLAQQLSQSFMAVAPEKAEEIRQVFAQLPAKFIDRKGELIDAVASLYAQELSVEARAVSAFYKSAAAPSCSPCNRRLRASRWRWDSAGGLESAGKTTRGAKELKKRGIELKRSRAPRSLKGEAGYLSPPRAGARHDCGTAPGR